MTTTTAEPGTTQRPQAARKELFTSTCPLAALSPLPLPPPSTAARILDVPDPTFGWLYELTDHAVYPGPVRPARPTGRVATGQTTTVDGTGIVALLPDSTILRSDELAYPPPAGTDARYCWVVAP